MRGGAVKADDLKIGGFQPFSGVDFPGALSTVVFCQGCGLRCAYCHNPSLVDANAMTTLRWRDVEAHLEKRRGLIDAVVFSGGEPLLQRALRPAAAAVKMRGMKVGLHTAGTAPERLRSLLPYLDWVGLDLKTSFERYEALTGARDAGEKARRSLEILAGAGVPFEARTTVWPDFHSVEELVRLARIADEAGAAVFALQQARDPVSQRPIASALFADPTLIGLIRRACSRLAMRAA
ncbi:MAG TPA: anaerobic ribonucleoside-triphosphate reductase activating protein [Parvularculaceae bacterium]|nr:anaerobic ribonucleoside-triphosphate reductase activating protein [Parvularculaceae bacterium]